MVPEFSTLLVTVKLFPEVTVNVVPVLIIIILIVTLLAIIGWLALVAITTIVDATGTDPQVQLLAVVHAVEVIPVQVFV
jgi:hypothetical protein